MSGHDTRASRHLTHLSVAQSSVLNQPRGRGQRSRSASPAPLSGPAFFPSTAATATEDDWEEDFADADEGNMPGIPADATPEEIRRMAEIAQEESRTMRNQQDRLTAALEMATQAASAAAAALQALALSNNAQAPNTTAPKRKRPELPALDKTNIHIWIQRVESAYAREDITDPKQKFAFLESVIGVNLGPTINNFMFGEASADSWSAFLEHLKDTYGPTKETRCSTFLDGLKRNSLRPSDHLALIRDRAKDVSLDDLQKQLILRGLPPDVRKLIQDKVANLDASATATLADAHFGKDGKPLNSEPSISSISQQQPQQQTPYNNTGINDQPKEETPNEQGQLPLQRTTASWVTHPEINAIPSRRPRTPNRNNNRANNSSSNRGPYTPAFQSGTSEGTPSSARRSGASSRSSRPPTPQRTSSQDREYSNCKLHAADPNSQVCNGPLCPLHARAKLCYSRRCSTHGQGGNGMGGRR